MARWRSDGFSAVVAAVVASLVGLRTAPVEAGSHRADRIIKKHVRALGGSKLKSLEAMRATGHVEVQGMAVPFTLWRQRPNLSRMEMSFMGHEVIQAYDGKTAWWVNPLLGASEPTEMPEEFAQNMLRWTDFDGPLVDYKRKRHRVKYLGEERLDTGKAHKLRVTLRNGDVWHVYLDSETFLEVKRTYAQTYQGRTSTVDTYFSDFIEVDGVTAPRVIRGVGLGGDPYTMTFDSFDTKVKADRRRFEIYGRPRGRPGTSGLIRLGGL